MTKPLSAQALGLAEGSIMHITSVLVNGAPTLKFARFSKVSISSLSRVDEITKRLCHCECHSERSNGCAIADGDVAESKDRDEAISIVDGRSGLVALLLFLNDTCSNRSSQSVLHELSFRVSEATEKSRHSN